MDIKSVTDSKIISSTTNSSVSFDKVNNLKSKIKEIKTKILKTAKQDGDAEIKEKQIEIMRHQIQILKAQIEKIQARKFNEEIKPSISPPSSEESSANILDLII